MRAVVVANVILRASDRVTPDLLLERSDMFEGLQVHEVVGVQIHEAVQVPGIPNVGIKLVRFQVDCEGPEDRIQALLEMSNDFTDDFDPQSGE